MLVREYKLEQLPVMKHSSLRLVVSVMVVSVTVLTLPLEVRDTVCPTGWINAHYEGCFKFLPEEDSISWVEAQLACERAGGFLAEPKNHEQIEFLAGIAVVVEPFTKIQRWWIGLSDMGHEGDWYWQHTGDQMVLSFWDDESPRVTNTSYNSRDCVFMQLDSGQLKWKDEECLDSAKDEFKIGPICQKDIVKSDEPALKCIEGWAEFNSSCFQFQSKSLDWESAKNECRNKDSELASVHSLDEYDFIIHLTENLDEYFYVWLGGTDIETEGIWEWSDGTPWDYQLGQFTQDGMEAQNWLAFDLQPSGAENISYWLDKGCYMEYSAVCRMDMVAMS